ncbi:MAG: glycine/betaine ABC transporter substrate-binding protein, partial [Actinobacteria bacterium]|nr:glycine/betaine ABC transporter substrate-binding protein [Actinomycetota bacterium]
ANDWVLLEDDQNLQPAENIVPIVREEVAVDSVTNALNAVSEVLTTQTVTEMIRRIRIDGEDISTVARDFLIQQGVLEG